MGRRDTRRRIRLIKTHQRIAGQHGQQAAARYRDLSAMRNCQEADQAQLNMYLAMGKGSEPVECPVCQRIPALEELTKNRPPCDTHGHPEQLKVFKNTGRAPVPCPLCGVLPQFSHDSNPTGTDKHNANATAAPQDTFNVVSIRDDLTECSPTGHQRAARDYFLSHANDLVQKQPAPCPKCLRTPQLQVANVNDNLIVVETHPAGNTSLHMITE